MIPTGILLYLVGIPVVGSWVFLRCTQDKDDFPVVLWAVSVYSLLWPLTVPAEVLVWLVRRLGKLTARPQTPGQAPRLEPDLRGEGPRRLGRP